MFGRPNTFMSFELRRCVNFQAREYGRTQISVTLAGPFHFSGVVIIVFHNSSSRLLNRRWLIRANDGFPRYAPQAPFGSSGRPVSLPASPANKAPVCRCAALRERQPTSRSSDVERCVFLKSPASPAILKHPVHRSPANPKSVIARDGRMLCKGVLAVQRLLYCCWLLQFRLS